MAGHSHSFLLNTSIPTTSQSFLPAPTQSYSFLLMLILSLNNSFSFIITHYFSFSAYDSECFVKISEVEVFPKQYSRYPGSTSQHPVTSGPSTPHPIGTQYRVCAKYPIPPSTQNPVQAYIYVCTLYIYTFTY